MKEWTSKEIDMVCELVGGNPEAIIRQLQSRLEELNQKVAVLQQENASLKQDAARYRWLRLGSSSNRVPHITQWPAQRGEDYAQISIVGIDAAIDTAMQANKGE